MPSFQPNLLASLLLAVALPGCDGLEPDASDAEPRYIGCPKCQFNAPGINGFPISSLDLGGATNDEGVTVRFVRDPDGGTHTLGVLDEEFAAHDDGVLRAHGSEMIKWEIVLDVAGSEQSLFITDRTELSTWAKVGPPISVYSVVGSFDDGPLRNVCPGQAAGATALTILHGETYDEDRKRVGEIGEQWITLACVDEAAFKLKRLGYGPKGNQGPGGKYPTLAQRNATLKMLTADYCGTGQSFTEFHVPVFWQNAAKSLLTLYQIKDAVMTEALWDEHGALCLTTPRFAALSTVQKVCSLPTCAALLQKPMPYEWKSFASTTFAISDSP